MRKFICYGNVYFNGSDIFTLVPLQFDDKEYNNLSIEEMQECFNQICKMKFLDELTIPEQRNICLNINGITLVEATFEQLNIHINKLIKDALSDLIRVDVNVLELK